MITDCFNDATRRTTQARILCAALFAVLCAQVLVVAQPRAKVMQQGSVEFRGAGKIRMEVVDAVRSSRIVFRSAKTGKTINPLTRSGRVASRSEFAGRMGQALAFKVESDGVTSDPLVLVSTVFRGADHCAFSVRLVGESEGRLRLLTDRPFETDDMGGLYVGDLGGGRGRGVAVWDFVWGKDEAHFDAHRYEVKIFKYLPGARRFVKEAVLRSKQRYASWEDAARELQLPYANALPVCEELFDGGVTLRHGGY
jgi:hypothetical protein